jgi:hypothetical protein
VAQGNSILRYGNQYPQIDQIRNHETFDQNQGLTVWLDEMDVSPNNTIWLGQVPAAREFEQGR